MRTLCALLVSMTTFIGFVGVNTAPASAAGSAPPSSAPPPAGDQLWTVVPGPDGLSVLSADASAGASPAAWRPVASLSVSGLPSRQWVGQGCVLRGTHTAAVMFGPIEYISVASQFESGGFAATVDLATGSVNYVQGLRPSFAYFSPKCGGDGAAQFTSYGASESTTTVTSVDPSGRSTVVLPAATGEVTDLTATPDKHLVGARGGDLVSYPSSAAPSPAPPTVLAHADSPVFAVQAAADGSAIYATDDATTTTVHQVSPGRRVRLAHGPVGSVAVDSVASKGVSVHGTGLVPDTAASGVATSQGPRDSLPSLGGGSFAAAAPRAASKPAAVQVSSSAGAVQSVDLPAAALQAPTGSKQLSLAQAAGAPTGSTTDPKLPCAIQRNDVRTEAYQPSPDQVEWAVDRAVAGQLTGTRPAGYRNFGLPAYGLQGGLFNAPKPVIPPQVMLGVLANESNLMQASTHVGPGGYGNPLTGNIYGRDFEHGEAASMAINFSYADCGYGAAQVTDGMRAGEMDATRQRAIALDYQANIAAGVTILAGKWNELDKLGITMNNGDAKAIENWYAALWAYNSGMQPNSENGNQTHCAPGPACTDSRGNWGLGWANNPANPIYPPSRHLFNVNGTDASHPSSWPYQERALGWAAYPIYKPGGSYDQAYWLNDQLRVEAVPSPSLFCDASNNCSGASASTAGTCSQGDFHCWLHHSVTWKDCSDAKCGFGSTAFSLNAAEPPDPKTEDPADCGRGGLPANAVIVDDVPSGAPSPFAGCSPTPTSGSFGFSFPVDGNGNNPAHIDLHQVNGGLNGHYWFTHTDQANDLLAATGTWRFPASVNGWGKVLVHVPALGAQTPQAHYTITDGSSGAVRTRVITQNYGQNAWISLGSMHLGANSTISLTSYSPHDDGSDVAWDAVAFVPGSRPAYKIVALGDSYSSGEGVPPFDSIPNGNATNACHRSAGAYARKMIIPGQRVSAGVNGDDEVDLLACSGARTVSVASQAANAAGQENPSNSHWGSPDYQKGQELQVDQGFLDADTDLVTLTIGGNDARFADVVQYCTGYTGASPHSCSTPGQIMPGDSTSLETEEPHVIRDLLPGKLLGTYKSIHAAAPNATILVAGYPRLFTAEGKDGSCLAEISKQDKLWLNSMGDLMNSTIKHSVSALAASGVKIHFVDPEPYFAGHELCTHDSYFNALILMPHEYALHPNNQGQGFGYAASFNAEMRQWVK